MLDIVELQHLIEKNEIYQWLTVTAVCAVICAYIDVFLFKHLFKIETKKSKLTKVFLIDCFLRFILSTFIKPPHFRAFEIFILILLFRVFLEKRIEKCILGASINAITLICAETIFSKIFCMAFHNIDTYIHLIYNYSYKTCLVASIATVRLIVCWYIKKKNFTITISDNLTTKNKNLIIIISLIGVALIYFNTVEMTMYISNFPFSIFLLDVISLITYFYISISDIIKIAKMEEQDMKINNLESYNKTLSIMYDNIRGFRHDYSNFLQALNGYAETNNIEGIRKMCKSATKECQDINGMGILDPKVINNPAVYSIITNKYYLAEEQGITVNINIMIDLKEIEICNYELCRILAILLDNAIEAAKQCEEKIVNITFRRDPRSHRKLLIIENTYIEKDIDLDKIFEKGYTSKEDTKSEHGLGLWNVRRILKRNNNLNLFTSKGEFFSQQLEIYDVLESA